MTHALLSLTIAAAVVIAAALGLAAIFHAAHLDWPGAAVYLLGMLGAAVAGVSLDRDLSTL